MRKEWKEGEKERKYCLIGWAREVFQICWYISYFTIRNYGLLLTISQTLSDDPTVFTIPRDGVIEQAVVIQSRVPHFEKQMKRKARTKGWTFWFNEMCRIHRINNALTLSNVKVKTYENVRGKKISTKSCRSPNGAERESLAQRDTPYTGVGETRT